MHYKDGTPAAINDVVRGRGYNLKDKDGNLREFIGTVVGLTPGSESCNIQVAHIVTVEVPHFDRSYLVVRGCIGCGSKGGADNHVVAVTKLEYGQCDQFEPLLPVMRQIFLDGKKVQVRSLINGAGLYALGKADASYVLFRRDEHGIEKDIGAGEWIEVHDDDEFYIVPPATF